MMRSVCRLHGAGKVPRLAWPRRPGLQTPVPLCYAVPIMDAVSTTPTGNQLACQLLDRAAAGRPDSAYRLARMVARVLVSRRLQQRRKWCSLAQSLAASPVVEPRLIHQALRWLQSSPVSSLIS